MSVISVSLLCSSRSHPFPHWLTYSFKLELPLAQEPVDSNIPSTPGAGKAPQPGAVTLSMAIQHPWRICLKPACLRCGTWGRRKTRRFSFRSSFLSWWTCCSTKGHLESKNGQLLKSVALRLHLLDGLVLYCVELGNASLPNLTCWGNSLTRRVHPRG